MPIDKILTVLTLQKVILRVSARPFFSHAFKRMKSGFFGRLHACLRNLVWLYMTKTWFDFIFVCQSWWSITSFTQCGILFLKLSSKLYRSNQLVFHCQCSFGTPLFTSRFFTTKPSVLDGNHSIKLLNNSGSF